MNVGSFQCICGKCRTPIFEAKLLSWINPDGIVEVTVICKCGRKFYGTFGIPEDFERLPDHDEVIENDKENSN